MRQAETDINRCSLDFNNWYEKDRVDIIIYIRSYTNLYSKTVVVLKVQANKIYTAWLEYSSLQYYNKRQFDKLYSSEIKSATTCYWDKEKDRQVQLRWENKFMNVFVHLYALKTEY